MDHKAAWGKKYIRRSAGFFRAIVISDLQQKPVYRAYQSLGGRFIGKLFKTRFTARQVHLFHVLEDELCLCFVDNNSTHDVAISTRNRNCKWISAENQANAYVWFARVLSPANVVILHHEGS